MIPGDKLVGIVSRANLVHALAGMAREVEPVPASDRTIRSGVVAELARQPWAPLALIDIIVKNGVVDLWGTITDERARRAIIVTAENVPGVKQVNDHLAWVDATSGLVLYQSNEEPVEVKAS